MSVSDALTMMFCVVIDAQCVGFFMLSLNEFGMGNFKLSIFVWNESIAVSTI